MSQAPRIPKIVTNRRELAIVSRLKRIDYLCDDSFGLDIRCSIRTNREGGKIVV